MPELNKKSVIYDAYLLWIVTGRCNLNCAYCYSVNPSVRMAGKVKEIDIPAAIAALDKTGKTFKIKIAGGGEPFLVPNLVEACVELAKKHYLAFFTNLTCEKVSELAGRIAPERITRIIASLHIKEIERLNLTGKYISHFLLLKKKGFNVKAMEVGYPSLVNEAEKYRNFFKGEGIDVEFHPFIGMYKGRKYPDAYTKEEVELFSFTKHRMELFYQHNMVCNAGYNTGVVLPNGVIRPCNSLFKTMGNIYKEIKFQKAMTLCPYKFCQCPSKVQDPEFFERLYKQCNGAANRPGVINEFKYKTLDEIKKNISILRHKLLYTLRGNSGL